MADLADLYEDRFIWVHHNTLRTVHFSSSFHIVHKAFGYKISWILLPVWSGKLLFQMMKAAYKVPPTWLMHGRLSYKTQLKNQKWTTGLSSGTNRCSKGAKQVKYGTEKWVFRTTFDFSLGTVGEQTKPIYIGERPAQIHRPISAWLKSRAAYINWIDMT